MAIAIVSIDLSDSPTWRQFRLACGGMGVALVVGCVLYAIETLLLHCPHRFVENPADTMTRAVGVAHFSIGWLFLFTSPRLRDGYALTRLAFWTVCGAAFCALFAWGGAVKNPLLLLAFYSFFFIHEVYDEAHLFRHSGELPLGSAGDERFLSTLCISMSLLLATVLAGLQLVRGHWFGRSPLLSDLPSMALLAGWLTLAVLTCAAGLHTLLSARLLYGSVRVTTMLYRPLLAVYAGIAAILLIGSLFGSIGANLVILIHGMTWLVYTHRKLSERPTPITGVWSWLRRSPSGFLTLHVTVTIVILMLFALRTHVWQRTGIFCDMLAKTSFPYWSIMHIAMAFSRGK